MAGWCTSVRTVTHSRGYVRWASHTRKRTTLERRATVQDTQAAPECSVNLPMGFSGGPCGTAPRAADAGLGAWAYLLDQLNDYRRRWGRAPLGQTRESGARRLDLK